MQQNINFFSTSFTLKLSSTRIKDNQKDNYCSNNSNNVERKARSAVVERENHVTT